MCALPLERRNRMQLPVLGVMMIGTTGRQASCLQAGANEFLSKPFEMHDLLGKVKELIEARHSPHPIYAV